MDISQHSHDKEFQWLHTLYRVLQLLIVELLSKFIIRYAQIYECDVPPTKTHTHTHTPVHTHNSFLSFPPLPFNHNVTQQLLL